MGRAPSGAPEAVPRRSSLRSARRIHTDVSRGGEPAENQDVEAVVDLLEEVRAPALEPEAQGPAQEPRLVDNRVAPASGTTRTPRRWRRPPRPPEGRRRLRSGRTEPRAPRRSRAVSPSATVRARRSPRSARGRAGSNRRTGRRGPAAGSPSATTAREVRSRWKTESCMRHEDGEPAQGTPASPRARAGRVARAERAANRPAAAADLVRDPAESPSETTIAVRPVSVTSSAKCPVPVGPMCGRGRC